MSGSRVFARGEVYCRPKAPGLPPRPPPTAQIARPARFIELGSAKIFQAAPDRPMQLGAKLTYQLVEPLVMTSAEARMLDGPVELLFIDGDRAEHCVLKG